MDNGWRGDRRKSRQAGQTRDPDLRRRELPHELQRTGDHRTLRAARDHGRAQQRVLGMVRQCKRCFTASGIRRPISIAGRILPNSPAPTAQRGMRPLAGAFKAAFDAALLSGGAAVIDCRIGSDET
jgi:hypothetical protein